MSNVIKEVTKTEWVRNCPTEQALDDFLTEVFGVATVIITSNNRRCRVLDSTCNAIVTVSQDWYLTAGTFNGQEYYETYFNYQPQVVGIVKYEIGTLKIWILNGTHMIVIGNVVEGQNALFVSDGFIIKNKKTTFTKYDLGTDLREPYIFPGMYGGLQSKKAFVHSKISTMNGCFMKHEGNICFGIGNAIIFP